MTLSVRDANGQAQTVPTLDEIPFATEATQLALHQSYQGAIAIVVGTDQTVRRSIAINCTAAGNVVLKLADDSTITIPASVGLSILPFAVKTVVSAGTTATATYSNLI